MWFTAELLMLANTQQRRSKKIGKDTMNCLSLLRKNIMNYLLKIECLTVLLRRLFHGFLNCCLECGFVPSAHDGFDDVAFLVDD